jgi:hypothetical protein
MCVIYLIVSEVDAGWKLEASFLALFWKVDGLTLFRVPSTVFTYLVIGRWTGRWCSTGVNLQVGEE